MRRFLALLLLLFIPLLSFAWLDNSGPYLRVHSSYSDVNTEQTGTPTITTSNKLLVFYIYGYDYPSDSSTGFQDAKLELVIDSDHDGAIDAGEKLIIVRRYLKEFRGKRITLRLFKGYYILRLQAYDNGGNLSYIQIQIIIQ